MNSFKHPYFNAIENLLAQLDGPEAPAIQTAAQWTAQALSQGHLIHTFGCGHSLSPALEPFQVHAQELSAQPCRPLLFGRLHAGAPSAVTA